MMSVLRVSIVSAFVTGLTACLTPSFNYLPATNNFSQPVVGTEASAIAGQPILLQGRFRSIEALYISEPVRVSWGYDLLPGYYLKQGEDELTETYLPGGAEPGNIGRSPFADDWQAVLTYKDTTRICVLTRLNVPVCTDSGHEDSVTVTSIEASYEQALIFQGRSETALKISYRELSNDPGRPSFDNDFEYDLSFSNKIAHFGAVLEIYEANEDRIRYRVLSGFRNTF